MTPQIGRPIQYTGTASNLPGTHPAIIQAVVLDNKVNLIMATVSDKSAGWHAFYNVNQDSEHGPNTWDYVFD